MTKFHVMRPATLQIADEQHAFIIDLIALKNSFKLDSVLTKIFLHPQSTCVGFAFKGDLKILFNGMPKLKFAKRMKRYLDAGFLYQTSLSSQIS